MAKKEEIKITALYERLSRDDEQAGESNSMRCSGSIPYGYKRKPDDKQTLIVDEPAAEVVRKIFRLVCQGNSTTAIAEMLTAEKVLIPSAYAALNQPKNCRHKNVADPYRWSATTVGYILDRQEYLGHTVTTTHLLKLFPRKNALPLSKPSSCERSRKKANGQQSAESRSWSLCEKLHKPETRALSPSMKNIWHTSVNGIRNTASS